MSLKVTDQNFDTEVNSGLTLVDFWAPWCGPCKMLGPVIEELSSDFNGKIKIAKLNVDENPMVSSRYSVMSIPTMILFKNGEPVEKIVGFQPKAVLQRYLQSKLEE